MSQTCMEAVPPVQSDTGCNRKQPVAAPRCALHMAKGPLGIGKRAARGQIPRYSDLDSEDLGRDYIGDEIVVLALPDAKLLRRGLWHKAACRPGGTLGSPWQVDENDNSADTKLADTSCTVRLCKGSCPTACRSNQFASKFRVMGPTSGPPL